MKIEKVDLRVASETKNIDMFLENNPGSSIFHTSDWNKVVTEVFNTDFFYLVAKENDNIIGVMPCHLVTQCHCHHICYCPPRIYEVSYGGPVAEGDNQRQANICRKLVSAAGKTKLGIAVSLFNSPENTSWTEEVCPQSNGNTWDRKAFETAYVDMSMSLEDIWTKSINSKKRNMIRKAQKNQVTVEFGGLEKLDAYYSIMQQMTEQTGVKFQIKEYYRRIMEAFAHKDMARIYLSKYMGKYLSGGIFLKYKQICYHWHGATGSGIRNMGQGELIQWHIIQWAKESGCRWYDLVGVEREKMPTLARFKMSFTKNLVPFHRVRYRRLVDALARKVSHAVLPSDNHMNKLKRA
ncbi:peptidoglycan bridge formation glycyltransferase FemA/FemB family protein [Candidatus Poribacteria bacterium]|nr:peptidoglycan bridge formation glycyltransferase FemA/FemB family protein [Candidatus Poribacteria bacterium]